MDKIQTLLLILLGLGAFVWWMVQKAREVAAKEARERPRVPAAPGLPATSFQELLDQMKAQNKAGNETPPPAPASRPLPSTPTPVPRSLERTEVPASSLETITPSTRSLEVPVRAPRRAATLPRTSLELPRDDYRTREASRSPDEARHDARRRVQAMLRNPSDLRAAIILSEILKPKY